jgi:FkbM family methyltransferase
MADAVRAALRTVRDRLARTLAWTVETMPSAEGAFVALGRAAAQRSRRLGGLYWHAHEHLVGRLRRSNDRYRRVRVLGIPIDVDVTDRTGRLHHFHDEPYEPEVTRAIAESLQRGDVFIDIGANIGYFAILAAHLVGADGFVIAFEPHPGAREELRMLARRNGVLQRMDIIPVALADRAGQSVLHLERTLTSYSTLDPSSSPMRASAAFTESIAVETATLDAWLAARPELEPRIRCIKIDVEGAEALVIAGMADMLRRTRARIVCETSIGSAADTALMSAGFSRRSIESGPYGNHLYVRD